MRRHLRGLAVSAACLFGIAAPAAAASCPNESIRQEQQSTYLSECRAYEQVSPKSKDGTSLDRLFTTQGAPSGESVAYATDGAFPGSTTSLQGGYFLSRRTEGGWEAEPLDAPQTNRGPTIGRATLWLTPDLGKTMQFSNRAILPGAEEGANLYLRDNLTGARYLAMASDNYTSLTNELVPLTERRPIFATPDLGHFVFSTKEPLTPDAAPGVANMYDSVGGQVRLVNVLPNGSVAGGSLRIERTQSTTAISSDGRRIVFAGLDGAEQGLGPLYLRVDGSETIPLSVSQIPGDSLEPRPAKFQGMSADGNRIFFMSDSKLTEDAEPDAMGDIYEYNVKAGVLTDLSVPDKFPTMVLGFLNLSADGTYAYVAGFSRIYLLHDGEVRLVADLSGFPDGTAAGNHAMSPSGRYFAYESAGNLTGESPPSPNCPGTFERPNEACTEIYLYDAAVDTLSCVTCRPVDGEQGLSGFPRFRPDLSNYTPRAVLDDGTVFVNSDARLVPEDMNGRSDVYRWRDGEASLVSPGNANYNAYFGESSEDGRDIFFFTRQQLVSQDADNALDLYDARAGGGIASENVAPSGPRCEGEACQAFNLATPTPGTPATAEVVGSDVQKRSHHRQRRKDRAKSKRGGGKRNAKHRNVHGKLTHQRGNK